MTKQELATLTQLAQMGLQALAEQASAAISKIPVDDDEKVEDDITEVK